MDQTIDQFLKYCLKVWFWSSVLHHLIDVQTEASDWGLRSFSTSARVQRAHNRATRSMAWTQAASKTPMTSSSKGEQLPGERV